MKTKYLTWLMLAVWMFVGCKPGVPSRYLQPDEMEEILYDFHLSQAVVMMEHDAPENAERHLAYQAVLKKHQVTQAEFDSSLVYYYSHAYRLDEIYKRVSQRLENQAQALGAAESELGQFAHLSLHGDTADVWNLKTSWLLLPAPPYNRIDFECKVDTSYRKGDSFQLYFQTNYLYQSGTKDATAFIVVEYDNDSIATFHTNIYMSGLNQLRVADNPKNGIKRLWGFFYLDKGNEKNTTLKLLFIDHIQLLRFHAKPIEPVRQDSVTAGGGSGQADTTKAAVPDSANRRKDSAAARLPDAAIMRSRGPVKDRQRPEGPNPSAQIKPLSRNR